MLVYQRVLLTQCSVGMNIHLPAILGFIRYQGFDPSPYMLNYQRVVCALQIPGLSQHSGVLGAFREHRAGQDARPGDDPRGGRLAQGD